MRKVPLAFLIVAIAAICAGVASSFGEQKSESPSTFQPVASCSSAGCHGGGRVGEKGSEQSTWAQGDPHAKAYRVLFNETSVRIAKSLKLPNAHEASQCLVCHGPSHEHAKIQTPNVDGVSCDACHGPSEKWVAKHYEPSWKSLNTPAKESLGFRDTKDLVTRVQLCTSCHVGDKTREVNHDMIAAGHPRLAFEAAKYHFEPAYFKHWKEPGDATAFEVRLWSIGQVANAKAANDLALARLERGESKPDLAELNCFACHQSLKGQAKGIGDAEWQTWNMALIRLVTQNEFPKTMPSSSLETSKRDQLFVNWQDLYRRVGLGMLEDSAIKRIRNGVTAIGKTSSQWDEHAQAYLALSMLAHADEKQRQELREPLKTLGEKLHYPAKTNSPANYDPQEVRKFFEELSRKGGAP